MKQKSRFTSLESKNKKTDAHTEVFKAMPVQQTVQNPVQKNLVPSQLNNKQDQLW